MGIGSSNAAVSQNNAVQSQCDVAATSNNAPDKKPGFFNRIMNSAVANLAKTLFQETQYARKSPFLGVALSPTILIHFSMLVVLAGIRETAKMLKNKRHDQRENPSKKQIEQNKQAEPRALEAPKKAIINTEQAH